MIAKYSGLPMKLDKGTGELIMTDSLLCDGNSEKFESQMTGLFRNPEGMMPDKRVYRAYRNIRFKEDKALFAKYDYRYDITVVLPGNVNGEYYKTSRTFVLII